MSSNRDKRVKSVAEEAEDRLTELPDELLHYILSFLDPQEVVKTSLLSKKWKFIWTGITKFFLNLEVNYNYYYSESEIKELSEMFVNFASKILNLCTDLKQFGVKTNFECTSSVVDSWVARLIKNEVEDIRLTIRKIKKYELPQTLFSYISLKSLRVNSCAIVPRRDIRWSCLKHLLIEDVKLSDTSMEQILKGCPVLEYLSLIRFRGLSRLNITSRNLTTLVMEEYCNIENEEVEVSSPYLRELMIIKDVDGTRFRFKNLSSLECAEFELFYEKQWSEIYEPSLQSRNYINEVFQSLQSAKELYLGKQCIEVLSVSEIVYCSSGWKLSPISTRLCLNVKAFNHTGSIPGILCILKSSPCIEKLVIEGSVIDLHEDKYCVEEFTNPALSYLATDDTEVILNHLKTVMINSFKCEQLPILVGLLLKGAKVLQKMVIKDSVEFSSDSASSLLTLPKASTEAQVIFE